MTDNYNGCLKVKQPKMCVSKNLNRRQCACLCLRRARKENEEKIPHSNARAQQHTTTCLLVIFVLFTKQAAKRNERERAVEHYNK